MTDRNNLTNEVTLLPCPFCGRSDATRYGRSSEFHEDCDGDSGNDDYFAVFCDASEPRGLGGCGASSGFAKTCEEAALRWNRRSTVEPPANPSALKCPTCKRPFEDVQISELREPAEEREPRFTEAEWAAIPCAGIAHRVPEEFHAPDQPCPIPVSDERWFALNRT
jgi:hypothetical protein